MILKDIVSQSKFEDVYECLAQYYEKIMTMDKERIREGYNDILNLTPDENKEKIAIVITETIESGKKFYDISGKKLGDDITYSLIFDKWEAWLSFDIEESILGILTPTEILTHCFWEMTWNGWTLAERNKNIKKQQNDYDIGKSLEERATKIKEESKSVDNEFLQELVDKYNSAKTDSLKFDIEIIVEDFINLELVNNDQIEIIAETFNDDDVKKAIDSIRKA